MKTANGLLLDLSRRSRDCGESGVGGSSLAMGAQSSPL